MAEKREREKEVLTKAQEVNNNYSKMSEEKLHHKMELIQENRMALNALKQHLREKVSLSDLSFMKSISVCYYIENMYVDALECEHDSQPPMSHLKSLHKMFVEVIHKFSKNTLQAIIQI